MRKLALLAPLLLVAGLAVLPQTSAAADFPALADGGAIVTTTANTDGGATYSLCAASSRSRGWNAVVRCSPFGVYYVACQDSTCTPTVHNQYLAPDVTYDLGMPGGHDTLCLKTFDGGVPYCTVNYKRDRGE